MTPHYFRKMYITFIAIFCLFLVGIIVFEFFIPQEFMRNFCVLGLIPPVILFIDFKKKEKQQSTKKS